MNTECQSNLSEGFGAQRQYCKRQLSTVPVLFLLFLLQNMWFGLRIWLLAFVVAAAPERPLSLKEDTTSSVDDESKRLVVHQKPGQACLSWTWHIDGIDIQGYTTKYTLIVSECVSTNRRESMKSGNIMKHHSKKQTNTKRHIDTRLKLNSMDRCSFERHRWFHAADNFNFLARVAFQMSIESDLGLMWISWGPWSSVVYVIDLTSL